MTDRRRINGPPSGTAAPAYITTASTASFPKIERTRKPNELRKIFLKTGLVLAAKGSAYLELESQPRTSKSFLTPTPTLKLSCSVHGPKPVSRTSSFSPNLQLNASVKFAPFATSIRRAYVRDASERDLGTHLETALKGVIIPDRWPKSAIDLVVTILEGEEDAWNAFGLRKDRGVEGVGMMNVLAGCITVASAALMDAKIDCLDLMAGGVAAYVIGQNQSRLRLLDPCPFEHDEILSACVVGYLPSRDEIAEIWIRGDLAAGGDVKLAGFEDLVDSAATAARGAQLVLQEAAKESSQVWTQQQVHEKKEIDAVKIHDGTSDVEMKI